MIVPWTLLLTAAVSAAAAGWWARRRARQLGVAPAAPVDLAVTVGLAALVAARLAGLAVDLALTGALPDPRAAVTLGAGLVTGAGVLGAIGAGAWAARRQPPALWRAVAPPAAAGLALWSVLSVARGAVGWPVPVSLLEAAGYGAAAAWLARTSRLDGARLGAGLAAVAAAIHLLGGVLRPAVPTADGDIEVLLGIAALAVSLAVAAGVRPRLVGMSVGAAAARTAVAAVAIAPGPAALTAAPVTAELQDAITSDGDGAGAPPPVWGPGGA
jgi:hypothetical protein